MLRRFRTMTDGDVSSVRSASPLTDYVEQLPAGVGAAPSSAPAPAETAQAETESAPGSPSDYVLHFKQVPLPFGMLRMTNLLEACARGEGDRVAAELEHIFGAGGRQAVDLELVATDDWAASSPLHWAAYAGSAACIDLLVEANADPSLVNQRDQSQPLHLAARYGHPAAAQALLDRSADVDAVNQRGNTPLHECCAKAESASVLEVLLRARASLEAYNDPEQGVKKMTPLLVASEAGSVKAIRQLLPRGADPFAYVQGSLVNPDAELLRKKLRPTILLRMSTFRASASGGEDRRSVGRTSRGRSFLSRVSVTSPAGAGADVPPPWPPPPPPPAIASASAAAKM